MVARAVYHAVLQLYLILLVARSIFIHLELRRTPGGGRVCRILGFHVPEAGRRFVEVGSGLAPSPGHIHIDVSPRAKDLDLVSRGDRLRLPSEWADGLLSIHMIEHVSPFGVRRTLEEWHRVVRRGGVLQIHTPDAHALMRILEAHDGESSFWAVQSIIYGYGHGPDSAGNSEELRESPDHRQIFTAAMLTETLTEIGFTDFEVDTQHSCAHNDSWAHLGQQICLRVTCTRL